MSLLSFDSYGQIPVGYYDDANGLTGEELRATLRNIISNGHVKLPYTSTSFDVWDAYALTDVRPFPNNSIIWDMYSDIPSGTPAYTFTIFTDQCGTASAEGDCYAREHLMPNSWWGGLDDASNPQYSDLHHLFPADQYVNNKKSANIVAETNSATWTSTNGSKVGPCSDPAYSGTVFEPIDEYKGDFARAFLYLATRYMDNLSIWITTYPTTDGQYIISNSNGNYLPWYVNMLLNWSSNDPVSQKEINRNDSIYYGTPQHNRNPFIDHPEYISKIWGSENKIKYYIETFNSSNATGLYTSNTYTGNYDVNWSFVAARDARDYPISANGLILRGSSYNSSFISDSIGGGINSISVDLKKAFTGAGTRQVSVYINETLIGYSELFDDTDIHVFKEDNLRISGKYVIKIFASRNYQVVIDNIIWNNFSYWLGYSTDWFDLNNWSSKVVPNSSTDVVIPGAPVGGFSPNP